MSQTEAKASTIAPLPWRDCECGCHGNALTVGSEHYWFITFPKESKPFELRNGHGLSAGQKLGNFLSLEDMDNFVFEQAKPRLEAERKQIDEFLALRM